MNTIQGMRDAMENSMPIPPAEEGTIIRMPEANPHAPKDLGNRGLCRKPRAYSRRHRLLRT
jgi:hypothetical protein